MLQLGIQGQDHVFIASHPDPQFVHCPAVEGALGESQSTDADKRKSPLVDLEVLFGEQQLVFNEGLLQFQNHRVIVPLGSGLNALAFELVFALGGLALNLLDALDFLEVLLATGSVVLGGRRPELLLFESVEFLLAFSLHLDVLIVLFVELGLLLLITEFPDEVI